MNKILSFIVESSAKHAWSATFLIRLFVGWIFIFAGLRKFLEPETMGTGRFADMGMPIPNFMAAWVGFWEIAGGLLVLLGIFTRAGSIPLIIVMLVAIWTTKVPVFVGDGLVDGLHAIRLDFALLVSSTYLLIAGSGSMAIDAILRRNKQ